MFQQPASVRELCLWPWWQKHTQRNAYLVLQQCLNSMQNHWTRKRVLIKGLSVAQQADETRCPLVLALKWTGKSAQQNSLCVRVAGFVQMRLKERFPDNSKRWNVVSAPWTAALLTFSDTFYLFTWSKSRLVRCSFWFEVQMKFERFGKDFKHIKCQLGLFLLTQNYDLRIVINHNFFFIKTQKPMVSFS